jgi:hypothetical protein
VAGVKRHENLAVMPGSLDAPWAATNRSSTHLPPKNLPHLSGKRKSESRLPGGEEEGLFKANAEKTKENHGEGGNAFDRRKII